jgi:hypothetical protein
MRVVPVGASLASCLEVILEGVPGVDGALADADGPISPGRVLLVEPVPMLKEEVVMSLLLE